MLVGRLAADPATLEAPLRKLFGSDDVRVLSSSNAPLTFIGMSPDTRALSRWTGRALIDGAERDWSAILKGWRRDPKTDDSSITRSRSPMRPTS